MALFKGSAASRLDASKVETLIGAEAVVQGVLSLKGSLRVDGRVEGNISDAQVVVVAEGGYVRGDISADAIVVGGTVQGNLTATEQVEILGKGKVRGDLRAPRLIVEDGAFLHGRCLMDAEGVEEEEPVEAVSKDA